MTIYNSNKYIKIKDLLKILLPAYEDPKKRIKEGIILPETNMLFRESISTLLSAILLNSINKNPKINYEILKYEYPNEGDGQIDEVEDLGKYKIVRDKEIIEQVYINNEEEGTTTDALIRKLEGKNNDPKSDRTDEVLCIFIDKY